MTHYLDPESVKQQTIPTHKDVPCGACGHTVNDGCSHVDCPYRKPVLHAPKADGATTIKHPPGTYDWRDDR